MLTAAPGDPDAACRVHIYYRNLALYDRLGDGPGTAKLIAVLTGTYGPPQIRSVLDLGCGTGRDLRHLTLRYPGSVCVGVDLQPEMLAFARSKAPALDWRVGDLRTFRFGRTVDVVVCVGNSLAYVHDDAGLRAAFATLSAHAHPDTLLLLYLPIAATPTGGPTRQRSGSFPADVEISYQLDPRSQVETMIRAWSFDDGHQEQDVIHRPSALTSCNGASPPPGSGSWSCSTAQGNAASRRPDLAPTRSHGCAADRPSPGRRCGQRGPHGLTTSSPMPAAGP